ncbi:IolC myo-catabolism protein [Candidatus Woesearchaeota archaeon]|nr:IolC myo-catabolism protein [Candidatus Woesearchaeota archaeon]|tara:strand:- start:27544 stop:28434 length:891 start_codon:yes stop_codon:yes gene_type:complete
MTELYILPFDHRGSFMKIIAAASPPTEEDVAKAKEYKKIIYEALQKSIEGGVPKDKAGILVDEWLGKEILTDAKSKGLITCTPLEKSGQDEFDFDREDWKKQIEEIDPTYVKVLVRYNPEEDKEMNARQAARLVELGNHLKTIGKKYLFELLVPATDGQMEQAGNDKDKYEQELRPDLMVRAIKEIQDAGVDPHVWKLEGLDSTEKMQKVGDQVKAGNAEAGIIILGRGESAEKAEHWLRMGAKVDNAVGFAVGRTVFKDALSEYAAGTMTREQARDKISENYSFFVSVWQKVKAE